MCSKVSSIVFKLVKKDLHYCLLVFSPLTGVLAIFEDLGKHVDVKWPVVLGF